MATTDDINRATIAAQQASAYARTYANQAASLADHVDTLYSRMLSSGSWKGAWSSSTNYGSGDTVSFNGSSYFSKAPNLNQQPDTNPSTWDVVAAGGSAGGTIHTSGHIQGDGSLGIPVDLSPIASSLVLGRASAGTGPVENLTGPQLASIVGLATPSVSGIMSAADKTKLNGLPSSVAHPVAVFVKSTGSDTNDGRNFGSAFQTTDHALSILEAAGGGQLHIYSQAGEVVGNIWLRGDGLSMPGWHGDFPLEVIGYGTSFSQFGFPTAFIGGGSTTDAVSPLIWLAHCYQPKIFRSVNRNGYYNHNVRMWDFRRDASGALLSSNVTQWVRNGDGTATVTLALPPAITVDSLTRTGGSNEVTMVFTVPRAGMGNMATGHIVRIASSDPNFDSGDFEITEATIWDRTTVTYKYIQTSTGGSGTMTTSAATIQFSGLTANSGGHCDRIQVTTTQPLNLPSSAYRLISASSASVITVVDVYGGTTQSSDSVSTAGLYPTTGTFTNPGTWVAQDRQSFRSGGGIDFHNIQGFGAANDLYDKGLAGPQFDMGSTDDGRVRIFFSAPAGYSPKIGTCPDPDRVAWALCDAGAGNYGAGINVYDTRPLAAGVRLYVAETTSSATMTNVEGDVAFTAAPPGLQVINGGASTILNLNNVRMFDNIGGDADVVVDNCSTDSIAINCGRVEGPIVSISNDVDGIKTLWNKGQSGFGWNGRLAADLPHVWRQSPIVQPRFTNLVLDPSGWTLGGSATLTIGVADPFGGNRAVTIGGSGGFYLYPQDTGTTATVGDRWVFGALVKRAGGFGTPGSGLPFVCEIVSNAGGQVAFGQNKPLYPGDGEWQHAFGIVKVTSVFGTAWGVRFSGNNFGANLSIYGAYLIFIPASVGLSDNEIAEYAGTLIQQSRTLGLGVPGTMEGVPLIGTGGLGIDSSVPKVAGAGSGQLTIGSIVSYEPRYAADGTTVIGWVPIYSATINP